MCMSMLAWQPQNKNPYFKQLNVLVSEALTINQCSLDISGLFRSFISRGTCIQNYLEHFRIYLEVSIFSKLLYSEQTDNNHKILVTMYHVFCHVSLLLKINVIFRTKCFVRSMTNYFLLSMCHPNLRAKNDMVRNQVNGTKGQNTVIG